MSKYKKFALSPSGEIINRASGTLSRAKNLSVKGNRVYKDGRLYGYIGKQTKIQQAISEKLDKRRQKRREREQKRNLKRQIEQDSDIKSKKITEKPNKTTTKPIENDDIIDEILEENEKIKESVDYVDDEIIQDYIDDYEKERFDFYESQAQEIPDTEQIKRSEPMPISEDTLLAITDINKWMKFIENAPQILPDYKKLKQEESNIARSVNARVTKGQISEEKGKELKEKWKNATSDKERKEVWDEIKADDPAEGFEYEPEIYIADFYKRVFIQ